MMSTSLDPTILRDRLHQGDPDAREELREFCLLPIERLVDRVIAHGSPAVERKVLIDRTLHWVEMYLRSRPPQSFGGMASQAFLAQILASAYMMLMPPEHDGRREPVWAVSDPLEWPDGYKVWRFCLPCEQVGGDWIGVDPAGGEDLWALVVDVTGHGYASYVTANGLSLLWQAPSIIELRASGRPPREVLSVMSQELEAVLPDETFVEAALGRFTPAGDASIAGAGVCRVIFRRTGQSCVSLRRIGGHLLGSFWGNDHEQEDWSLSGGDELTIASDGLYEQPDGDGHQLEKRIVELLEQRLSSVRITHDAVLEVLSDVVGDRTRHDDISVLSVLRLDEVRK